MNHKKYLLLDPITLTLLLSKYRQFTYNLGEIDFLIDLNHSNNKKRIRPFGDELKTFVRSSSYGSKIFNYILNILIDTINCIYKFHLPTCGILKLLLIVYSYNKENKVNTHNDRIGNLIDLYIKYPLLFSHRNLEKSVMDISVLDYYKAVCLSPGSNKNIIKSLSKEDFMNSHKFIIETYYKFASDILNKNLEKEDNNRNKKEKEKGKKKTDEKETEKEMKKETKKETKKSMADIYILISLLIYEHFEKDILKLISFWYDNVANNKADNKEKLKLKEISKKIKISKDNEELNFMNVLIRYFNMIGFDFNKDYIIKLFCRLTLRDESYLYDYKNITSSLFGDVKDGTYNLEDLFYNDNIDGDSLHTDRLFLNMRRVRDVEIYPSYCFGDDNFIVDSSVLPLYKLGGGDGTFYDKKLVPRSQIFRLLMNEYNDNLDNMTILKKLNKIFFGHIGYNFKVHNNKSRMGLIFRNISKMFEEINSFKIAVENNLEDSLSRLLKKYCGKLRTDNKTNNEILFKLSKKNSWRDKLMFVCNMIDKYDVKDKQQNFLDLGLCDGRMNSYVHHLNVFKFIKDLNNLAMNYSNTICMSFTLLTNDPKYENLKCNPYLKKETIYNTFHNNNTVERITNFMFGFDLDEIVKTLYIPSLYRIIDDMIDKFNDDGIIELNNPKTIRMIYDLYKFV